MELFDVTEDLQLHNELTLQSDRNVDFAAAHVPGQQQEVQKMESQLTLKEVQTENSTLKEDVHKLERDLRKARNALKEQQEAFAGSDFGSDKIARRVVELSKRNRDLVAQSSKQQSTIQQLQEKLNKLSRTENEGKIYSSASKNTEVEELKRKTVEMEEELSSLKAKLATSRNQIQSLKQELSISHKVLSKEVGEGFSISELLSGASSGWRGRAQQITSLQTKVADLKRQIKTASRGRPEGGTYDDEDKEINRLRHLELQKKTKLEVKVAELDKLKPKYEEMKQQILALKARNQTLSSKLKEACKSLPATPLSQESVLAPHSVKSAPLTERRPTLLTPICPHCKSSKAIFDRELARKEKNIQELREQLKALKDKEKRCNTSQASSSASGVMGQKNSLLQLSAAISSSKSDDCVGAVEWRTRGQVAEVENDKLMQMVTLLHQRLDEAVKRIAQLQNKANKKSSLVEADLLKETKEELLERLLVQADESAALKDIITNYQSTKAQDIKLLTELLKQAKLTFSKELKAIISVPTIST